MNIWVLMCFVDHGSLQKKVQAIAKFRVKNLKDLRAFLGACNFFRRHVKSFTYSSAGLTDLLKKNARFVWSDKEEALIEEIKNKLLSSTPLGVPRSTGEMIVVTDASDRGGEVPSSNGKPSMHPKYPKVFPHKGCQKMESSCTITQVSFVWCQLGIGIGSGTQHDQDIQLLSKSCWREF